jgi:hypothetical protein
MEKSHERTGESVVRGQAKRTGESVVRGQMKRTGESVVRGQMKQGHRKENMRYRSILRSFERRAPKPRPNIVVRWVDGQTIHINGDGPHEPKPERTIPGDDASSIPTGRKADRRAKKP